VKPPAPDWVDANGFEETDWVPQVPFVPEPRRHSVDSVASECDARGAIGTPNPEAADRRLRNPAIRGAVSTPCGEAGRKRLRAHAARRR